MCSWDYKIRLKEQDDDSTKFYSTMSMEKIIHGQQDL